MGGCGVKEDLSGVMTPEILSMGKKWPEKHGEWGRGKSLNEDSKVINGLEPKARRPSVWEQRRDNPEHLGSQPVCSYRALQVTSIGLSVLGSKGVTCFTFWFLWLLSGKEGGWAGLRKWWRGGMEAELMLLPVNPCKNEETTVHTRTNTHTTTCPRADTDWVPVNNTWWLDTHWI